MNHATDTQDSLSIQEVKAMQVNDLLLNESLHGIQTAVGGDFIITATGATPSPGLVATRESFSNAISYLAEGGQLAQKLGASFSWCLGDIILECEQVLGPAETDQVIGEAVSVFGLAKHTVMEAVRVCRLVPKEERTQEFTFTHHLILLQAKNKLSEEDYAYIEGFARDGRSVTLKIGDQEVTHQKPRSTHEIRDEIRRKKAEYRQGSGNENGGDNQHDSVMTEQAEFDLSTDTTPVSSESLDELEEYKNLLFKILDADINDLKDIWKTHDSHEDRLEALESL